MYTRSTENMPSFAGTGQNRTNVESKFWQFKASLQETGQSCNEYCFYLYCIDMIATHNRKWNLQVPRLMSCSIATKWRTNSLMKIWHFAPPGWLSTLGHLPNAGDMMTLSNGYIFSRYWPYGRGIHRSPVNSRTDGSDAGLWCFLWSAPE